MIRKTWKSLVILFVLLFLYLPILVLMVYSFTDATNIGAIKGFSLHNSDRSLKRIFGKQYGLSAGPRKDGRGGAMACFRLPLKKER